MHFVKMHGAENDYIFVNNFLDRVADPSALAREVSHRHRGIGSDGLILLQASRCADARMRIFNADGSEAEMCGNGARCAARFLYDDDLVRGEEVLLETLCGVRRVRLLFDADESAAFYGARRTVTGAEVEMGVPVVGRAPGDTAPRAGGKGPERTGSNGNGQGRGNGKGHGNGRSHGNGDGHGSGHRHDNGDGHDSAGRNGNGRHHGTGRTRTGGVPSAAGESGFQGTDTEPVEVGGRTLDGLCVSVGNPHFVIFVDDALGFPVGTIGPRIEKLPIFPDRTNVEFVQVCNDGSLLVRVWERGSAETRACGTGAVASVAAAMARGFIERDRTVPVRLKGGELKVHWDGAGPAWLAGEAVEVCRGTWRHPVPKPAASDVLPFLDLDQRPAVAVPQGMEE